MLATYIGLASFAGFLFAQPAFAQFSLPGLGAPIAITLSPAYPGPYTAVTASVSGSDVNNATVSWFLDGKSIGRGVGLKTASLETGALGKTMVLQVVAATSQGELRATKEITPAEVALVAEPIGYAPPFYRGKTLNAEEATVRVVAIPTFTTSGGALLAPSALTYQWTRNGQVVGGASGRGKNVLTLSDLYVAGGAQIGVEARSSNGSLVAGSILSLKTNTPQILFYEEDPLLGLRLERALDTYRLTKSEGTLTAIPYFVSVARRTDPSLSYAWRLNGGPVTAEGKTGSITFRETGGAGTAEVAVAVSRAGSLFEKLEKAVRVVFGDTQN